MLNKICLILLKITTKGWGCLHMRAEIIPYTPDPDNTGEGKPELPF
jgi:hypothetical protein